MSKHISLTSGSITKSLILFTFPVMLSLFLQTMYGAVDLFVVGHFSSIANVTGVTVGGQHTQLITSLCSGLAMGTTILIGQKKGENDLHTIGCIISNTIIMFSVLSFVLVAVMLIFLDPMVVMLKTPTEAFNPTKQYLFYSCLGIPMIAAYNVLGSIFRGLGDSKTPLMSVVYACIANIILDIVFVAGFGMGSAGAAIATVLAQGISVAICIYILIKQQFYFGQMKFNFTLVKNICNLGIPVALQSMVGTLSFVFMTVIVNQYNNSNFSAGFGISQKICGFIMLIPVAFMQSISVYTAQNIGANQPERAKKALGITLKYSLCFAVVTAYIAFFHGEFFINIFSRSADVMPHAKEFLKAFAIDTLLVSFIFCFNGYFSGLGKTKFVMLEGVLGSLLIRTPLAYIFSIMFPASGFFIGLSIPVTTFLQTVCCFIFFFYVERQSKKA